MPIVLVKKKVATKKKRKPMVRRREYRTTGTMTVPVEVSVMARTRDEAERIAERIIDMMHPPKGVRLRIGKRTRLLKDNVDYFIETGGAELDNPFTEEAEDHNKILT